MSDSFKLELDKVDGYLSLELEKGNVLITAKDKDTYLFGKIHVKDARDIKGTRESSLFLECDNADLDKIPTGFKELRDVIFTHYKEQGTGYFGFILLGQERKIVIEISLEDYKDLQKFFSDFID